MARLRRAATVPNAVAASSIGQLIHLHVKIQMKKKWPMVDHWTTGPGGSIPVQKNKASDLENKYRNGPDTPRSSKKQRLAGELIVDENQGGYVSSP